MTFTMMVDINRVRLNRWELAVDKPENISSLPFEVDRPDTLDERFCLEENTSREYMPQTK